MDRARCCCCSPWRCLAGCNSTPKRDPEFAAVPPAAIPPVPQGNGAIFQAGFERSWFENVRARRVGDILVVNLVEETEASHTNTGTVSTRATARSITNPTLFGHALSSTYRAGLAPTTSVRAWHPQTDFSGDGDNTQNNEFSGSISVMVTEVLANGYLRVRGEKRIGMTGGNEYIRVSGIVRPEDIDTEQHGRIDHDRRCNAGLRRRWPGRQGHHRWAGWRSSSSPH